MIARRVVRRYAAALFHAAQKNGLVDAVESDLGLVSYAFETCGELRDAIRSPVLNPDAKRKVLAELFAGRIQQLTLDYLNLLVEQRREEAIRETEREYVALANEFRSTAEAEIVTAVALPPEIEERLIEKLAAVTGKKVTARRIVDPGILGGVIVRIGDRVIDGSIRGSLAALKERLSE